MSDQQQRPVTVHPAGSTWGDSETKGTFTRYPEALHTIFARLNPSQVEQFTQSYQLWSLQQRIAQLQQELASIEQQVEENSSLIEMVQPSPIALSVLARLQASGVENLLLLDRMLDRGDIWLDHTAQLLERCEKMDLIRGDYTRWCENALEGAYDWLESMSDEQGAQEASQSAELSMPPTPGIILTSEEQLLQRLMHEEELLEGEAEPTSQPEPAPTATLEPGPSLSSEPQAASEQVAPKKSITKELPPLSKWRPKSL
ncbi:hypothetical protein [Ktedonospora formicarum]|uniref:Uncharacterized protein n=1 Tax=Ktedonospora formicarum TaxID=2778364 RepID=A0A8J3MT27_9CHLR|nr:hypothetical protein [Ktedonospora formicarum]GHO45208.1 hypothetical protein KSX_33710 [Ktedonospora formicarum]